MGDGSRQTEEGRARGGCNRQERGEDGEGEEAKRHAEIGRGCTLPLIPPPPFLFFPLLSRPSPPPL